MAQIKTARQARDYLLSKADKLIDNWLYIIDAATNPMSDEADLPDPQLIRALTDAVKLVAPASNLDIKHDLQALTQQQVNRIFPEDEITPASIKAGEIIKQVLTGKMTPKQAKDLVDNLDHLFDWSTSYQLENMLNELSDPDNMPKLSAYSGIARH